jgi:hypothetical protein
LIVYLFLFLFVPIKYARSIMEISELTSGSSLFMPTCHYIFMGLMHFHLISIIYMYFCLVLMWQIITYLLTCNHAQLTSVITNAVLTNIRFIEQNLHSLVFRYVICYARYNEHSLYRTIFFVPCLFVIADVNCM